MQPHTTRPVSNREISAYRLIQWVLTQAQTSTHDVVARVGQGKLRGMEVLISLSLGDAWSRTPEAACPNHAPQAVRSPQAPRRLWDRSLLRVVRRKNASTPSREKRRVLPIQIGISSSPATSRSTVRVETCSQRATPSTSKSVGGSTESWSQCVISCSRAFRTTSSTHSAHASRTTGVIRRLSNAPSSGRSRRNTRRYRASTGSCLKRRTSRSSSAATSLRSFAFDSFTAALGKVKVVGRSPASPA